MPQDASQLLRSTSWSSFVELCQFEKDLERALTNVSTLKFLKELKITSTTSNQIKTTGGYCFNFVIC